MPRSTGAFTVPTGGHPSEPEKPPEPALIVELPPADAPAERDWSLALPASGGVLGFDGPDDRLVQLLVAADVRAAARTRLLAPPDPDEPTTRTDLRPLTRRVRFWPAGSQLEGDLLFHRIAHAEHPELARAALDRASAWFLHVDPDEPFPKWRKVATNELAAQPAPPSEHARGTLLGPIRDKHACQRAIDELNDLFDLCRYHHILVQAPSGQACAYKELGKCPAPCDGSETMEAYRARVREAIAFWRDPAAWREHAEHAMNQAARDLHFEAAARWKERLTTAAHLETAAFTHARGAWELGWIVLAGDSAHGIRVLHAGVHGVRRVLDLPATTAPDDAWRAIAAEPVASIPPDTRPTPLGWQLLGVLAQRLYAGARPRQRTSPETSDPSAETGPQPTPTPRWSFAAFVSANPWDQVNRFTSSEQAGTVSVRSMTRPRDPADQAPEDFDGAWRAAARALARRKPNRRGPTTRPDDRQGPAE